jgi:hypothetical protein
VKRDMDLVRTILLKIEEDGDPELRQVPTIEGFDEGTVTSHVALLMDAGLVSAIDASTLGSEDYIEIGLSWAGYEFLENVRDPEIWRTTKSRAAKVGSFSLSVIADIAKAAIVAKMQSLGLG